MLLIGKEHYTLTLSLYSTVYAADFVNQLLHRNDFALYDLHLFLTTVYDDDRLPMSVSILLCYKYTTVQIFGVRKIF